MIQWPCILKLDGDCELIFVASKLQLDEELEGLIWGSTDCLIDSAGQRYAISQKNDTYLLEPRAVALSLQSVTDLIQAHEFAKAEMCLTKIHFTSIEEAIQSVEYER